MRENFGLGQGGLYEEGCCSSITYMFAYNEIFAGEVTVKAELKDESVMRQKWICCSRVVWHSLGVSVRLTA